jgi:hypothetical protein
MSIGPIRQGVTAGLRAGEAADIAISSFASACSATPQHVGVGPITHEIPGPPNIMAFAGAPKKLWVSTIIDS